MKQGDTVAVTIAGQVVAQATVREVGEGEVTLVVPGTIVRMATRTQLAPEAQTPEGVTREAGTEHQILGVDTTSSTESTSQPVAQPVGGTPEVAMPAVTAPSSNETGPVGTSSNPASVVDTTPDNTSVTPIVEPVNPTVSDEQ